MSIAFEAKKADSRLTVSSYENGELTGTAEAISDGVEWSRITKVSVRPEYKGQGLEKELIRKLGSELNGQHIFVLAEPEEFSLYEELGYLRSKTSFTYIDNVSKETFDAWENRGLFLPEGFRYEEEFYPRKPFIDNGNVVKKEHVGEIRYSDSLEGVSLEEVNKVLSAAFGGHERDLNKTADVFLRSQKVEIAYDGESIVGVARAVTDGVSEALILNVAVDPAYQGYHIGWNIVVNLSAQLPGYLIFLNTHPGAVGFYNRKGFRRNKTAFSVSPARPGAAPNPEITRGFTLPAGYRFPDEYPESTY